MYQRSSSANVIWTSYLILMFVMQLGSIETFINFKKVNFMYDYYRMTNGLDQVLDIVALKLKHIGNVAEFITEIKATYNDASGALQFYNDERFEGEKLEYLQTSVRTVQATTSQLINDESNKSEFDNLIDKIVLFMRKFDLELRKMTINQIFVTLGEDFHAIAVKFAEFYGYIFESLQNSNFHILIGCLESDLDLQKIMRTLVGLDLLNSNPTDVLHDLIDMFLIDSCINRELVKLQSASLSQAELGLESHIANIRVSVMHDRNRLASDLEKAQKFLLEVLGKPTNRNQFTRFVAEIQLSLRSLHGSLLHTDLLSDLSKLNDKYDHEFKKVMTFSVLMAILALCGLILMAIAVFCTVKVFLKKKEANIVNLNLEQNMTESLV